MRQTVVVMTALVIALLGVSGFIVAGSVGQVEQFNEATTRTEALALGLKKETERADGLQQKNEELEALRGEMARQREELLKENSRLSAQINAAELTARQHAAERDAFMRTAQTLAQEQEHTLAQCEALVSERDELQKQMEQARIAAARLEKELQTQMDENAAAAMEYERRAQEDAQTIQALGMQAETLQQAAQYPLDGERTSRFFAPRPLVTLPPPKTDQEADVQS